MGFRRAVGGVLTIVVFAVFAIGCSERHRRIELLSRPLGVGLTGSVWFFLIECDGPPPPDLSDADLPFCENRAQLEAHDFEVETAGLGARVVGVRPGPGPRGEEPVEAVVEGLAEGTARFTVTINGLGPVRLEVPVAQVRSSFIIPFALAGSDVAYLEQRYRVDSASVFAGSLLGLAQSHHSVEVASGELPLSEGPLNGDAEILLTRGEGLGSLTNATSRLSFLSVFNELGTIELTTEVGGILTLDVVDQSAIVAAEIRNGDLTPAPTSVVINQGLGYLLAVVPLDTDGELILGDGVEPMVAADGAVVAVDRQPAGRIEYLVAARAPGTTNLEFRFDGVQAAIPITVE